MSLYFFIKKLIALLNKILATASGLMVLCIGLMLTTEVILRSAGQPSEWIIESSTYLFAATMLCGMAYTQAEGRHIRVELLFDRIPLRLRTFLEICTSLVCAVFCLFIMDQGWLHIMDALETGETTATTMRVPIAIKDSPIVICFALLTLQFLFTACDRAISVFQKKAEQYKEGGPA